MKFRFTRWYNRKTGRKGRLWESRFSSTIVEEVERALRLAGEEFVEQMRSEESRKARDEGGDFNDRLLLCFAWRHAPKLCHAAIPGHKRYWSQLARVTASSG